MKFGYHGVVGPVRKAVVAVMLGASALMAQAQGFSSAASVNRSAPDVLEEDTGAWTDVFQARTDTQLRTPVQIDPSTWRLEHRLGFAVGYQFQSTYLAAVLMRGGTHDLAYDLSFTVADPARVGYTLTLDTLLAGVMQSSGAWAASVSLPGFSVAVDYGLGFVDLAGLSSAGRQLDAGSAIVNEGRRSVLGEFFGTRSFDVRVRTPADDAAAFSAHGDTRPNYVQFGLPLTSSIFTGGTYPSFDGRDAGDHGHFLTVQAVFNTSPVPEPEAWALLAAGLGLFGLRRRGAA